MTRSARTALAGVLAAAAALATTELVALADATRPSLLLAVETWFIASFGAALKDIAVALFDTGHKTALTVGSLTVAALLGVIAARIEVRRRWLGVGLVGAAGVLGVAAEARHPQGSVGLALVAAVAGVGVGAVVLLGLLDRFGLRVAPGAALVFADRRAAARGRSGGAGEAGPVPLGEVDGGREADRPALAGARGTRREVLLWGLGTGAVVLTAGAVAKGVGDGVRRVRSAIPSRLPTAARPADVPGSQPFSVDGLSPYLTPNDDFYLIDTSPQPPYVVTDSWTVKVTGMVGRELELSYDDLLARDLVEEVVTLACVSNEVGGDLVGNARWTGVPLRDLLEEAGVDPAATQLVGESVDGFTAGFPTAALDDPDRVALVAVGMDGEPLPRAHGFPARLVVSGLYGYVSATKWLSEIRLTTMEDEDGYWIRRGWAKEAPVKTQSRIDVPRRRANLVEGTVPIAGVAWAPNRGISKVEVRVDGGDWQEAELGRVASDDTWVQWHLAWDAPPGDHEIEVRATDGDGETQGEDPVDVLPDGAEGWHSRQVSVAAR